MQLRIGFSPCPNDTFMVEGLLHDRVEMPGIDLIPAIDDVETLNAWALQGKLDVTKMSFGTWLRVREEYSLLHSGAALGRGCGPLVIAGQEISAELLEQGPVAIPGAHTTAHLLFSLRYPDARNKVHMVFSDIEDAVLSGRCVAGVIIHENRFTYADKGLVKVLDLGEYWEEKTGCPIPLGGFAIKKELGAETAAVVEGALRRSIQFAFDHPDTVMPYVRSYAQEMSEAVMRAHIDTYVNSFSLDLGQEGLAAIEVLDEVALASKLL